MAKLRDGTRIYGSLIVDDNISCANNSILGLSTVNTLIVGGGTSTGVTSTSLQVTGVNSSVYIGGSLGIGSESPQFDLDFRPDSTIRFPFTGIGTALRFSINNSDITLLRIDGADTFGTTNSSASGFSIRYLGSRLTNSKSLSIFSDNQISASQIEAVTILQDGLIGINSASPTSRLDIVGDAELTGVVTALTHIGQINAGFGTVTDIVGRGLRYTGVATFTSGSTVLIGGATSTGTANQIFQVSGVSSSAYIGGTVGIGTTIAGARLNVVPNTTEIAGLFSGTTSGDMVRITQLGTGNALVVEDETNPDSTPFVISNSGIVGIGSTNPGSRLAVIGDTFISGVVTALTHIGQVNAGFGTVTNITGRGLSYSGVSTFASGSTVLIGTGTSTGTAGQILQVAGVSSSVYIGGTVGIGTTNPTEELHLWTSQNEGTVIRVDNPNTGISANASLRLFSDTATLTHLAHGSGRTASRFGTVLGRFGEISLSSGNGFLVGTQNATPLILGTNDTEALRIASSQNVGVGTTISIGARLHIAPTTTGIAGLFSGTTSNDMVRITQLGTGNAILVEDESNPDATPFVVGAAGSVGIGTLFPVAPLTVTDGNVGTPPQYPTDVATFLSNIDSYSQINFSNINSGPSASGDFVVTADIGTDATDYIDMGLNNSGFTTSSTWSINGALDGYLYTANGNLSIGVANTIGPRYLSFFTGGLKSENERIRIVQSGSIGIATTNPSQLFQIGAGNTLGFSTDNKVFVVTANGDTGIGTLSPIAKLHVIGDARLTGVVTALTHIGQINAGFGTVTDIVGRGLRYTGVSTFAPGSTVLIGSGTSTGTANQVLQVGTPSAPLNAYIGGTLGIGSAQPVGQLNVSVGPVIIGSATSTGFAAQALQIGAPTNLLSAYVSGNLGVGSTNPGSKLSVVGDAYISGVTTATDFNATSDKTLKTNIQTIKDPIEKVLQLNGVTFNWKDNNEESVGVIAQDVEKVFPQLVHGLEPKTVSYNGLVGLLIECVKEQQKEIEELKRRI